MNYPEGDIFGTDIVKKLRKNLQFTGLVFIRSANTEDEDLYLASGATAMLHKTVKVSDIAMQLARFYTTMVSHKIHYY